MIDGRGLAGLDHPPAPPAMRLIEIDLGEGFRAYALRGVVWVVSPWGYVELSANELSMISTVDDPPKFRVAARGESLGAISAGALREDGVQEEMVLLQFKRDERHRHLGARNFYGEMTAHFRDGGDGDASMRKLIEVRHDGIEFLVPVRPTGGVAR